MYFSYFSTDAYIGYCSGLRVPLPGLKRPEHEVDHIPTASAEVMDEWRYNPFPLYIFVHARD
jgi:hypothetical protein